MFQIVVVKKYLTQIDGFSQTRSHFVDSPLANAIFDFFQKLFVPQTRLSSYMSKKSSKPRGRPLKATKAKEEVDAGIQSSLDGNFLTSK